MWDDGPVMVVMDILLLANACVATAFLLLYVVKVRFETSTMGRLIAANGLAWILVIIGSILYRVGSPETAQWFFIPIGFGLLGVQLWWIRMLVSSQHDESLLEQIYTDWTAKAKELEAYGKSLEAEMIYRRAEKLRDAIDIQDAPA